MNAPAKLIIGRVAAWTYIVSAVLAVVFTISFFDFPGGPATMGYAVVFLFLLACAVGAVASIAAVGAWKEKKKIVFVGALAWPLPIYYSTLIVRAILGL